MYSNTPPGLPLVNPKGLRYDEGNALQARPNHIHLRNAEPIDEKFVWEVNNEATVRSVSLSTQPIPYHDHIRWFASKLGDDRAHLAIVEVNGERAGVLRLEQLDDCIEISLALEPSFRGRGVGTVAIRHGCRLAGEKLGAHPLVARVLRVNAASIRAFEHAGFVCDVDKSATVARLTYG